MHAETTPAKQSFLKKFLSHDSGHLMQFIKYGIAGGLATVTNIVLIQLAAWKIWPCLQDSDILVKLLKLNPAPITDQVRALNFIYCTIFAFIFSNAVAYALNLLFVFKGGRHHWVVEIALFYLVSGISIFIGTALAAALINFAGVSTDVAVITNIVTAVLINYAMRKFFIFKS